MTKYFRPRLLILGIALILPGFNAYLQFERADLQEQFLAIYLISKIFQFALPLLVWWMTSDRSFKAQFSIKKNLYSDSKIGLLTGVGAVTFILSLFYLVFQKSEMIASAPTLIQEKLHAFGASSWSAFMVFALLVSLVHSFLEEYYWRSYVFHETKNLLSKQNLVSPLASALVISSLGFSLHHFLIIWHYAGHQGFLSFLLTLPVAIAGAIWALCLEKTGRIWAGWLCHILADLSLMWIGYEMAFN